MSYEGRTDRQTDIVTVFIYIDHPIAYKLCNSIKASLDKMIESDINRRVQSLKWVTPIVTPIKSNGQPRICGDFKITLNPILWKHASITRESEDLLVFERMSPI